VFLVGGEWVLRFPRRAVAVPLLEREAHILPSIAPRLPLAVPVIERLATGDERFPWTFAGHRRVAGRAASDVSLDDAARAAAAEPLARFLRALHAIPSSEATALGAGGDELARLEVARRAPQIRERLAELGRLELLDEANLVRHLRAVDETPVAAPRPSTALVHGDLYARHVLVDDGGRPCGVIDWGDVHLGDPAVDLALAHGFLPAAARDAFRRAYGEIDAATWALARFRAIHHASITALYARDVGDEPLLHEALRSLRS